MIATIIDLENVNCRYNEVLLKKLIQLEQSDMTPEQWKEEFRKELDALRKPIERLGALLTLHPGGSYSSNVIKEIFADLEKKDKNEHYYNVDINHLEILYNLLRFLPKPYSYLNWLKKEKEILEILHFSLRQFFEFCSIGDEYSDICEMDEARKEEILYDIATKCEHWIELLKSIQNSGNNEEFVLFPDEAPEHVNKKYTSEDIAYTCKPVYLLLNNHPWNQKAKELLGQVYEYESEFNDPLTGNEKLHIISLIEFGIISGDPKMIHIHNSKWFNDIEHKVFADFRNWPPIQIMYYITAPMDIPEDTLNNLPGLMDAENTVEGASALLWHLKEQMEFRHEI